MDNRLLRIAPDVRYRLIGEEAVIVRQNSAEVLVLNSLGSRILSLLSEGREPDRIRATLLDEYDVEERQLSGDMERFLDELLSVGLIVSEIGGDS
jgi:hypothetical protein